MLVLVVTIVSMVVTYRRLLFTTYVQNLYSVYIYYDHADFLIRLLVYKSGV